MSEAMKIALGYGGAFSAVALGAFGSALGTGAAGAAAVGAWKKCYMQKKPAPMQLAVFAGAPLSQTIYGFLMMNFIRDAVVLNPDAWPAYLLLGMLGGLAMAASALFQGKAGAGACDALVETGQGFSNYLIALGIIETTALFAMVFGIMILGSITGG
ncbi:MAG: V-type ATP synthase subunit K [Planctomycetes bacterium]|nr:V-type ATP synthase subunit K [Planctomycetota bacterium]